MRLLLWSEYFFPAIGGIERSVEMLARELTGRGHKVFVMTSCYENEEPNEEIWRDIHIYRFSFGKMFIRGNIPSFLRQQAMLLRVIDEFDPEVYHLFGLGAGTMALLRIRKQRPRPLLVRLANTLTKPDTTLAPDSIVRKAIEMSTWVTAVSQAVLDQARSYIPSLASHSSVLYNGHPAPTLQPTALATPPRILFVGRLVEQKNCSSAIAAFAEVHKQLPTARLIIAGDGIERAALEEQASVLGDAVEFMGWCPPYQVHSLMNSVTLVIIPSRWEGLPNVAIEAAYMGRPVVATRIPGMAEVVLDGKSGILVEPGNIHELAEAMLRLLDHPDQAGKMGKAANSWAHQQFTIIRCANETEALYTHIIELSQTTTSKTTQ